MNTSTLSVLYKSLEFLGYPAYRVGSDGSVWSGFKFLGTRENRQLTTGGKWKRLKVAVGTGGYHRVVLCSGAKKRPWFVHRLVLLAFVGEPPTGHSGCHNDGNPANNAVENLRWDTPKANMADRVKHGTAARGERGGLARLTADQVRDIRRLYSLGHSQHSLASQFGLTRSGIMGIVTGRCWKHLDPDYVRPSGPRHRYSPAGSSRQKFNAEKPK